MTDDANLAAFQAVVAESLELIRDLLIEETKITLVIRMPGLPDGGILVSDDDPESVIGEIRRLAAIKPV